MLRGLMMWGHFFHPFFLRVTCCFFLSFVGRKDVKSLILSQGTDCFFHCHNYLKYIEAEYMCHLGVETKNSGVYPQIIHFNRVGTIIIHPFWDTPIFGNINLNLIAENIHQSISFRSLEENSPQKSHSHCCSE